MPCQLPLTVGSHAAGRSPTPSRQLFRSLFSGGLVLIAYAASGACSPASNTQADTAAEAQAGVLEDTRAADEAAIRALRDAFGEAQMAGDAERTAAFYTDDAIIMVPGTPSVSGRTALQTGLARSFDQFVWRVQEPIEELQVLGDWAFTRTTWAGTQTDKGTGAATELSGKSVHIYRRQPDGTWRIAVDIYNFDHPIDAS